VQIPKRCPRTTHKCIILENIHSANCDGRHVTMHMAEARAGKKKVSVFFFRAAVVAA